MAQQLGSPSSDFPLVSILDTDLYKFSMQQAVLHHCPSVEATYKFKNRNTKMQFTTEAVDQFRAAVAKFTRLSLTAEEKSWLQKTTPYFKEDYLTYLSSYRFKPEQVHIEFKPSSEDASKGDLDILISGPWHETILWEVPLMACLSEIYFRLVDTDWNYDQQGEIAYEKAKALFEAGCVVSEFGVRRRRSLKAQEIVLQKFVEASNANFGPGKLVGTSDVYLAFKYGLNPVGTIAHEWFMGLASLDGYEGVHERALSMWEDVYHDVLLTALTDTFTTQAFFKEFEANPDRARKWKGLRQDSGDPFQFAPRAKGMYEKLGIDHHEKVIIYSDSLDVEKAIKIKKQCDELDFPCSFGIGTFLTNDFKKASSPTEKSKALNIVIKLNSVNGKPCVKISDDITKNTGDVETVKSAKEIFGLPSA